MNTDAPPRTTESMEEDDAQKYSAMLEATFKETIPTKRQSYFVTHKYTDRANDDECPTELLKESTCRGGVKTPFPQRLHEMLEDIERTNQELIISWQPHGRSFLIHKPEVFARDILPLFFSHSNFKSFQRQLNLWGFNRITQGLDKGAYYNEYFLRGKRLLTRRMQRQRVKGTSFRGRSSPDAEPDFYSMAFVKDTRETTTTKLSVPTFAHVSKHTESLAEMMTSEHSGTLAEVMALVSRAESSALDSSMDLNFHTIVSDESEALKVALEMDDLDILMNQTDEDSSCTSIDSNDLQFFTVDSLPSLVTVDFE